MKKQKKQDFPRNDVDKQFETVLGKKMFVCKIGEGFDHVR